MNAVIYARYSSHNQREESIEGQIRVCTDYANKNNMTVIKEYCDRAISGKTDKRPSFQRLIKDSEKGKFEAVIVYTLDRFARNRYDSAIYKARLKKNGVKVFYATQPITDTPEGIILESVMEGYAEYYSENLARNVKRGMTESAMQCRYMCRPPFGYKIDSEKHLVIDPKSAAAIEPIFIKYLEGESKLSIANWLNEQGYKSTSGKDFGKSSLDSILKNVAYKGTYRHGDIVIDNGVPALISKELFDDVQAKLTRNYHSRASGKAKNKYLLTGKLFCGMCGSHMVGECGYSHTGKVYNYYKCNHRKTSGKCDKTPISKDLIEDIVVKFTANHVLTDNNIEMIANKAMEIIINESKDVSRMLSYEAELINVEKRIKNIMNAIEEGIFTETTKARLQELENDRHDLEHRILKEKNKKPLLSKEQIIFWLESFRNGDVNDENYKANIIDTLVNSVFIYEQSDKTSKIVLFFNLSGKNTATLKSSDIESLAHKRNCTISSFFVI